MTATLVPRPGVDLEEQIRKEFERDASQVSVFVWLPHLRKLFEAYKVFNFDFDLQTRTGSGKYLGYDIEMFRVRYHCIKEIA
ncbi:MAG: hypothetical protein KGL42_07950 [Betaproteobacteria bacterium]|nr:hypothetical protein [Betaproteobacteria bacterium]